MTVYPFNSPDAVEAQLLPALMQDVRFVLNSVDVQHQMTSLPANLQLRLSFVPTPLTSTQARLVLTAPNLPAVNPHHLPLAMANPNGLFYFFANFMRQFQPYS